MMAKSLKYRALSKMKKPQMVQQYNGTTFFTHTLPHTPSHLTSFLANQYIIYNY